MRKIFWCCTAAAAAVCAALWAVTYLSQHSAAKSGAGAVASVSAAGPGGSPDDDGLIPPDPVPVVDLAAFGPARPPAADRATLAAAPTIFTHDEEDLNPASATAGKAAEATPGGAYQSSTIDLTGLATPPAQEAPALMPYCNDDATIPAMPYADDDEDHPSSSTAPGGATLFGFWLGFLSGPQPAGDGAHCQEDPHYAEHYSGCPYTGGTAACPAHAPTAAAPAFPGGTEDSEPAAPRLPPKVRRQYGHVDFGRDGPLFCPQPKCDTMEQRPTDFKPYSLDPGPF
jgi:hypothetical protein